MCQPVQILINLLQLPWYYLQRCWPLHFKTYRMSLYNMKTLVKELFDLQMLVLFIKCIQMLVVFIKCIHCYKAKTPQAAYHYMFKEGGNWYILDDCTRNSPSICIADVRRSKETQNKQDSVCVCLGINVGSSSSPFQTFSIPSNENRTWTNSES